MSQKRLRFTAEQLRDAVCSVHSAKKWRRCCFPIVVFYRRFSVSCPGFCLSWWLIRIMCTNSYVPTKFDEIWLAIWWELGGCPIQARYPFRVSNLNPVLVLFWAKNIEFVACKSKRTIALTAHRRRLLQGKFSVDFDCNSLRNNNDSWYFHPAKIIC